MSSSFVTCSACGDSSATVEWGFVLMARHGWTAQLGHSGTDANWYCSACSARVAVSTREAPAEPRKARARLRVLLVDDQVLVLRATASMLRELEVVTAGSAAEALAKLADGGRFDVIVSDVSMPQMSGPELYVRVRERYPHLAARFLFLSGDSYGASLQCAAVARRENLPSLPKILDKPVPREVLLREVEALGQRRSTSSGTFSIAGGEVELQPPRRQTGTK